jgi:hypothetical protein
MARRQPQVKVRKFGPSTKWELLPYNFADTSADFIKARLTEILAKDLIRRVLEWDARRKRRSPKRPKRTQK